MELKKNITWCDGNVFVVHSIKCVDKPYLHTLHIYH